MLYMFATSSVATVARRVPSSAMRAFGILIMPEVPKSEASASAPCTGASTSKFNITIFGALRTTSPPQQKSPLKEGS